MKTYIHNIGSHGPLILWGMHMWQGDEMEKLISALASLIPNASYTLAAFDPEDWNDAFSPWEANSDSQTFSGLGYNTLNWLSDSYIPYLAETYPGFTNKYIVGYSLAGLFSLWAWYESSLFDGAASCSGSLWFPEWDSYIQGHTAKNDSRIYLSLGGKEKNSKSTIVSSIEDKTKLQYNILNEQIDNVTLEMNPGGHFSNPELRTAKGIAWLINNTLKDRTL